jgi:hypothetical protein
MHDGSPVVKTPFRAAYEPRAPRESRASDDFALNGVDAATGEYLPAPTPREISAHVLGEKPGAKRLVYGVDSRRLDQSGWGVVFAPRTGAAVRSALRPLLDHRAEQAGELYREEDYQGESKPCFLARHGVGYGAVNPADVPYYLLLVGDPEEIPFEFQHQLDVQYAVGRLCFDTPEEYERYAGSVLAAETGKLRPERRIGFFAVRNHDDRATELTAGLLAVPLADSLSKSCPKWRVERRFDADATKESLTRWLGRSEAPAVVFTACHGLSFPSGHDLQRGGQGALLCQDWPGPRQWHGAIPRDFYFAADDVGPDAQVGGRIVFHFGCYSAGTPRSDDYVYEGWTAAGSTPARTLAPRAFLSRLPQRLLGHPRGGALAVVGHVERAWDCSFRWRGAGSRRPQLQVFESALRQLLDGYPVGAALDVFHERYAEIATEIDAERRRHRDDGDAAGEKALASLWTARNDARNYALLGDPAVRLAVGQEGQQP